MKFNGIHRPLLTALFSLASLTAVFSQSTSPYTIKGHITGLRDTSIYLANYYGKQVFFNDTAQVDSKGNFQFKGKPHNECGKYALVIPGPKVLFDFIVAEENIVMDCDTTPGYEKLKFKESANNQEFMNYVNFIRTKTKEREPLDKVLGDSTLAESAKTQARADMKKLNDAVIDFQKKMIAAKPDMLVSKLMKMQLDVEVPDYVNPHAADASYPDSLMVREKARWQYYWYREHYWDNVDLTDNRLVRDPAFHRVLEKYMNQVMPQVPDTAIKLSKQLIERTAGNEDGFKYIVHQLTYFSETSKIMCMDKVFVWLVDNFYKTGKATWVKKDKLEDIIESADHKRYCLCDEIGPDIILPDTTGENWVSMYDQHNEYTLLVIWEATCGHCKKEIPKLLDLYHKYKSKGFGVFAVEGELENDKWVKFVKEKNLDWINVSDTPEIMKQDSATKLIWQGVTTLQSLNFRTTYDVNSTPKVYLLDKNHKVIAKQLSSEQLDDLLDKLFKGEGVGSGIQSTEYDDE